MFDNGAWSQLPLCVDQADPSGPTIARTPTRITEWALNEATGNAQMVWNYEVPTRYAIFAGSAQRLPNGNTMIGWASSKEAVASEVNAAGKLVWDLKNPGPNEDRYFTYRATLAKVPDSTPPVVKLGSSINGATYLQDDVARAKFSCTDRGGSGLKKCRGTTPFHDRLDTRSIGAHTVTVTAADSAGNTTSRTATYTVVSGAYRPDAQVRKVGGPWIGSHEFLPTSQALSVGVKRHATRVVKIRVVNAGLREDGVRVAATGVGKAFRASYYLAGQEVTHRVRNGTFKVTGLAPGASVRLRVELVRSSSAHSGAVRAASITASSVKRKAIHDTVVLRAVARS